MTTLTKLSTTIYTPEVPGVPATPGTPGSSGSPYVPAHWKDVTTLVPGRPAWTIYLYFSGGAWRDQRDGGYLPGMPTQVNYIAAVPDTYITSRVWVPAVAGVAPVPAIPGTPAVAGSAATTTTNLNLGWQASAVSIEAHDGNFTFEVSASQTAIGIVVGLNNQNLGSGYVEIDFGFYFTNGKAIVYEGGVAKTSAVGFINTDVFKVTRVAGVVTYYKNATLLYTSLTSSLGPLFADCSIYSAGDAITAASFIILPNGGSSYGSFEALNGRSSNSTLAGSLSALSPISGTSSDYLANSSFGTIGPLSGWSSNQPLSWSDAALSPLDGVASAGGIIPSYTVSASSFSSLLGTGRVLVGEVATSNTTALDPLVGLSANRNYASASTYLESLTGYAEERATPQSYAYLFVPPPTLTSAGHNSLGEQAAFLAAPSPTLSITTGANSTSSAPKQTLSATGTVTTLATAALVSPLPILIAAGTVSGTSNAALRAPIATLVGYSGAVCSITLTGSPTLSAIGTTGSIGGAQLVCPLFELTATATAQNHGSANLLAPSPEMGRTAQAWLTAPGAQLTAIGQAVVTATYEAYATNLKHNPKPGVEAHDEVTHYTNFPFTHVVRYQNSYYGANSTGLYLLEGTTDNAVPITWDVKTATTDFKSPQNKTVASAYFGGRLGPADTITLHAGEGAKVQAYSYTTPRGALAQNHRQVFGKGIKSHRYYALEASGTGELALDDISLDVHNLSRRI